MKISEITTADVLKYCRVESDIAEIPPNVLLSAAKSFVYGYAGLSQEEADQYDDLSIAVLVLCSDMYDNRQTIVDSSHINRVAESIISMHSKNLL